MESAVQSGRRDERVPLDALIELCADDGDEVLEADGLDLSPGGLAVRAGFVPPIGARLKCQFRCSPDGERVRAEGEVVWGEWASAHDGAFGLKFLELDTKSAMAIRRYVEPENEGYEASQPAHEEQPPTAQLCIDGVGAPVDTDVLYTDEGSIVLEQELNFLRLGRGVSVDVGGQARRGRIGSVELRHSALDVPTLVFGILLDPEVEHAEPEYREQVVSLRARAPESVRVPEVAQSADDDATDFDAGLDVAASTLHAEEGAAEQAFEAEEPRAVAARVEVSEARERERHAAFDRAIARAARRADVPVEVKSEALAEDDGLEAAPSRAASLKALLTTVLLFWSRLRSQLAQAVGPVREATLGRFSKLGQALSIYMARVRLFFATQFSRWSKVQKDKRDAKRRSTAPAPRVQRSRVAGKSGAPAPRTAPANRRGSRLFAVGLAVVGVALGVYTLAPRSGADRIRVQRSVTPEVAESVRAPEEAAEPANTQAEAGALLAPTGAAEAAQPAAQAAQQEPASAEPAVARVFGEQSVANGRTFTLRMSGPVDGIEGERREDGFTVRIPGRLALDRASPIATSHRAVARAMILNRGDYAELTVDFLPGLRPKYQVTGKDATIEVTLERL